VANLLEQLIEQSRKLTPATKSNYLKGVKRFVAVAGAEPSDWTPRAIEKWAQVQAESIDPRSVNVYLAGVKFASKRFHEMEYGTDFAKPIEMFQESDEGDGEETPRRTLSVDEARRLISTCPNTSPVIGLRLQPAAAMLRDRALILVSLLGGLRRFEVAKLRWTDLKPEGLLVHGKGRRNEIVPLDKVTPATLSAIEKWRLEADRKPTDPIFHRIRTAGLDSPSGTLVSGEPLTTDGIYKILRKRAAQARVENISPHSLRHTCASFLLALGWQPWRVAKYLRHRSFDTTFAHYTHLDVDTGLEIQKMLDQLGRGEL